MLHVVTILSIVTIVLSLLLLIRYFVQFAKFETHMTRQLLIFFVSLSFSTILDSLRFIWFATFNYLNDNVDYFCFIVKLFFILVGISALINLNIHLVLQSGYNLKHTRLMKFGYYLFVLILVIINLYTVYKTTPNEFGFYFYQINQIFFLVMVGIFTPIAIGLAWTGSIYLKKIEDKELKRHIILLAFFFAVFTMDRLFDSGIGFFLEVFVQDGYSVMMNIINLSIIIVILFGFLIEIVRNPQLLERASTYFSLKSLYLFTTGGQTLFKYELLPNGQPNQFNQDEFLIGAFISALTSGLRHSLNTDGQIKVIEIGDLYLTFKHGTYISGILFISEHTPIIDRKLTEFMNKFEKCYKDDLKNWTGELSKFQCPEVEEWINEIFK